MLSLPPPHIAGPLLGVVAAVSLNVTALAIRRGASAEDGSSFDALLIVLVVNVVLLMPVAFVVYYPEYDLNVRSVGAFAAAGLVGTGTRADGLLYVDRTPRRVESRTC